MSRLVTLDSSDRPRCKGESFELPYDPPRDGHCFDGLEPLVIEKSDLNSRDGLRSIAPRDYTHQIENLLRTVSNPRAAQINGEQNPTQG